MPVHVIDNRTGVSPSYLPAAAGNFWTFSGGVASPPYRFMASVPATNPITCWTSFPNTGHWPDAGYIPYLLSGDWKWLALETEATMSVFTGVRSPDFIGIGTSISFLGAGALNAEEERGIILPMLAFSRLVLIIPDADTTATPMAVLGYYKKDEAQNTLQYNYTGTGSGSYLAYPAPGIRIADGVCAGGVPCTPGNCPGGSTCNTNFQVNDWRIINNHGGGWGFEYLYGINAWGAIVDAGMCNADCMDFYTWYAAGLVSSVTNTATLPGGFIVTPTYHWLHNQDHWTWATIWPDVNIGYTDNPAGWLSGLSVGDSPPHGRAISGTTKFSGSFGTPGASITITFPTTGYWGGGTAYNGGQIQSPQDGGRCTITAVTDPVVTCTVNTPFTHAAYTQTNYAGSTLWVPFAMQPDAHGLENGGLQALFAANYMSGFLTMAQTGCTFVHNYLSVPRSSTACSALMGYSGGRKLLGGSSVQWNYTAF